MAPPVVLLHGLATSSARTWGETGWIDLLADAGRTAVPIDLPGHGEAPRVREPAAYEDLDRQVLAQFPPGVVDAVGHSLGARILLTIAASGSAHRFRRLVVAGVGRNLFERDEARAARIAAAIGGVADPEDPEARHFHALADAPDIDRESLGAMLATSGSPLDPTQLAAVTVPVLVVLGDRDFAGPADPLLEALPQATLVTLRGVDHFATPKTFEFIDAGLEFLGAAPD